jgi:Tfp pilus assembly protein PilF
MLAPRRLLALLMAAVGLHALAPAARRLAPWAPLAVRLAAAAVLVIGLSPPPAAAAAALALPAAAAAWSGWQRRHPGAPSAAFGVALAVVAGSSVLAPGRLDVLARDAAARPRVWVWRGMQAARSGDDDAALADYRRALAGDPGLAGVHAAIGEILWNARHDTAGAEAAFRDALEADPRHMASRANLGRLLRTEGRAEEGLDVLSAGLAERPGEAVLWLEKARCLAALERPGREAAAWRRYLELSAGRPGQEEARAEARVRLFRLQQEAAGGAR